MGLKVGRITMKYCIKCGNKDIALFLKPAGISTCWKATDSPKEITYGSVLFQCPFDAPENLIAVHCACDFLVQQTDIETRQM